MSRVDDDLEARAAARRAEARRAEEQQKTKKAAEGQVFGKLVGQQKTEGQARAQQASAAKSAIAQLLESAEAQQSEGAKETESEVGQKQGEHLQDQAAKGRLGQSAQQTTQKGSQQASARSESGQQTQGRAESRSAAGTLASNTRGNEAIAERAGAETKGASARSDAKTVEKRKEDLEGQSLGGAGGARGQKGDLKADTEAGGGGAGGGKDKDQANPGAAAANFRFNPALMAPPGVAKPKEATGSDRLRKVANELAQKIVERVRVGTNAMGKVEFQVDLRNDVLAGLSVKVSAQNGKIRAVFSGKDKDVLKMIEEQGDALKKALSARGLTLEEFKIEARA